MNGETENRIRRDVRDGIPVYWVPEGPEFSGLLSFRVGRADESVIDGGLTHLVEHLALFGLGPKQPYSFNGWVDGLRTSFYATGLRLSASQDHAAMWMGCQPEDAAVVQERLLDVLDELARDASPVAIRSILTGPGHR